MCYKMGTTLTCRHTGEVFFVVGSTEQWTQYGNDKSFGRALTSDVVKEFVVDCNENDFKDIARLLECFLTTEEVTGWVKGNFIVSLIKNASDVEEAAKFAQMLGERI